MAGADVVPSRFVQEREYRQSADKTAWQNLVYAWRLVGTLDETRLRDALSAVARRHEVLRTAFREIDGEVVQVIAPAVRLPWVSVDLASTPPARREEALDDLIADLLGKPFSLTAAPLFRIVQARLRRDEQVLVLVVPHILWDAWSTGVFIRDLLALYDGDALPELPIQFGDFASFERRSISRDATRYWRRQLSGYERRLSLPDLRPSRAERYEPGEHRFQAASSETATALEQLANAERTTLPVAILGAFIAHLAAVTDMREITVAAADANRGRDELRDLLGYLVTVNLIRVRLADRPSLREIVRRTHEAVREAYAHELPVEHQAEDPQVGMLDRTPLSDAFFNFVPATVSASEPDSTPTLVAEPRTTPREWAKFPTRSTPWGAWLDFELWARPSGAIEGVFSYDAQVFTAQRACEFANGLARRLSTTVLG